MEKYAFTLGQIVASAIAAGVMWGLIFGIDAFRDAYKIHKINKKRKEFLEQAAKYN